MTYFCKKDFSTTSSVFCPSGRRTTGRFRRGCVPGIVETNSTCGLSDLSWASVSEDAAKDT